MKFCCEPFFSLEKAMTLNFAVISSLEQFFICVRLTKLKFPLTDSAFRGIILEVTFT